MEMLLTGDRFPARWAERVGLVDRVVDDPAADILRSLHHPSGNESAIIA
jgi:enoyl-CoA hydratase/carnithine racemase